MSMQLIVVLKNLSLDQTIDLMKSISFFGCLFLLLSLASCKKEEHSQCNSQDRPAELILGAWDLKSIYNPWSNETTYPEEEGYSVVVSYLSDGTYILDDTRQPLIDTGTYEVISDMTVNCRADECIYMSEQGSFYVITCDSLIKDSTPVDGPRKVYSRFK